jgi:hypothetical protein
MAAGTVSYTDTRGNKDYLGIIANQIGSRIKQASDMAAEERAYASKQAEKNNTSLEEAGIGRGYFFGRALGSRFGGDKIARTRGRLGTQGPGTDPSRNYKQRFRGGFDYNYSEQINQVTKEVGGAIVPMSSALSVGLRGVESGLSQVSQSISSISVAMGQLAVAQQDLAKQAMMNGAFMRAFMTYMQRQQSRAGANREERLLEGGRRRLGGGGGRGAINITPGSGGGGRLAGSGSGGGFTSNFFDTTQTVVKSAGQAKKAIGSAGSAISTGARAATQSVDAGGALVKAGTSTAKFVPQGAKIGQSAAKLLKVPAAQLGKFFGGAVRGAKALPGIAHFRGMHQAMMEMSALGMLGKGGFRSQLMNFITGGPDYLKGLDNFKSAYSGPGRYGRLDSILAASEQLDTFEAMTRNGSAIVRSGNTIDVPINSRAADDLARGIGAADAQALAAARMAAGDRAGLKPAEMATDAIIKKGTKQGLKKGSAIAKMMVKQFGAAGTKSILKKIPVIAGVAGILFGIQRAMEGDFLGAGLEITSGLLGATGVGAPLGLGIDGFLLARDLGLTPMAKGGILTQPTPVVAGEAGAEGFFPLEGARGKKTFTMFGEGILQAQKDNKSDYGKIQAEGHKRYYEGMNGWKRFGEILKGLLPSLPELPGLPNPLSNDPLSAARRFAAGLIGGYDKLDPTAAGSGLGTYGTGLKTGPSSQIGGSSAYHIDSQFKSSLSMEEKVKMMDDLAAAYAARGRKIEFSNKAVSGQVWDSSASMEVKMALLQKAFEAHQIPRGREVDAGGFNRIDYYIPKIDENRFGASAEGAEILVPTRGASTMDYLSGGDYGAFVNLKDKDGNIIFRTGHGDKRGARSGSVDLSKVRPEPARRLGDQSFVNGLGQGEAQSRSLYQQSAVASLAPLSVAAPTVINNNYYTQAGGSGTEDTFGSSFSSSNFTAFITPFSLASKT